MISAISSIWLVRTLKSLEYAHFDRTFNLQGKFATVCSIYLPDRDDIAWFYHSSLCSQYLSRCPIACHLAWDLLTCQRMTTMLNHRSDILRNIELLKSAEVTISFNHLSTIKDEGSHFICDRNWKPPRFCSEFNSMSIVLESEFWFAKTRCHSFRVSMSSINVIYSRAILHFSGFYVSCRWLLHPKFEIMDSWSQILWNACTIRKKDMMKNWPFKSPCSGESLTQCNAARKSIGPSSPHQNNKP